MRQMAHTGRLAGATGRQALVCHAKLKISQAKPSNPYIQLDQDKLYSDASYLPSRAFGPVKLTPISGQGRGLVLTSPVGNGTLLLVSEPIGKVVRAAEGLTLQMEHLLPTLQQEGALSEEDRRRLRLLFNGEASSNRPVELSDFLASSTPSTSKAAPAKKSKGFGAVAAPAATTSELPSGSAPVSSDELQQVLRYNLWGQEYSDLGAAATRGERSYSYVGLWPEFALVNHSCIPNTTTVLVGDRLLVRAARAQLMADVQVTTSYLGFDGCAPVSERRRRLEHTYGFTCACPRCKLEASQPDTITALLEDMWGWLSQGLGDRVRSQLTTGDHDGVRAVQHQLEQHVGRLEALMEQHQVQVMARDWLRASAYGVYELLAIIRSEHLGSSSDEDDATGRPQGGQQQAEGQLPASLVPLMEVIAPGSDGHLYLTLEWLELAGKRYGTRAKETEPAAAACLTVHLVRYGRVSDNMLQRLMVERSKTDFQMGRINLPTSSASTGVDSLLPQQH